MACELTRVWEALALKILGIHADVTHLGGHTRLFLMMIDVFKSLGYNVHIVSRTGKESKSSVEVQIMDPTKGKPLLLPAEVTATMNLTHHNIKDLRKFQPVRHLTPDDVSTHDIPVICWGDRFLTPWAPEVVDLVKDADYVFCDTEMYVRLESDLDIADKHIQYVHFPTENVLPVYRKEPKNIWANSSFTRSWIRIRWGYDNPNYSKASAKYVIVKIPKQIFNAEVVHPPLYVEDYKNDFGFKDRCYDVVMFARLGEDKFTVAGYLDEHFKLLSMGAFSPLKPVKSVSPKKGLKRVDLNMPREKALQPYKPKGELHKNLTFDQIKQFLRQAKVYVHGKGFGRTQSGGISEPEHFGLTICEALASGCPAIVPRAGGCWSDISLYGKYTLGYSSLPELKANIEKLIHNKDEWIKWHNLALEGVQRFDAENTKKRIKELLG